MKDDGKLVIGVWGSAAECEALKVLASIASLLPEPVAGSPGPLALSEEGKVEGLLTAAGFKLLKRVLLNVPGIFHLLMMQLKVSCSRAFCRSYPLCRKRKSKGKTGKHFRGIQYL